MPTACIWEVDGAASSMDELRLYAQRNINAGNEVYIGLAGISKRSTILGEIDNDEKRMIELGSMARRLGHKYVVLKTPADQPGHDRARFGESWLTRQLGLSNLMNRVHGGAGRRPFYDSIGAVFVLVGE